MVVDDEDAAKPEYDDDHDGAKELRHRMSRRLTDVDAHDIVAIGRIDTVKATVHTLLGTETECLCLDRLCFQFTAYPSHEPSHDGHDNEGEKRQFPRDEDEGSEIADNEDRVLEEHLQRCHDGVLDLLHVTTHAGDDITFALLGEESEWQRSDLLVELVADIAHDASPDGNDRGCGEEIGTSL